MKRKCVLLTILFVLCVIASPVYASSETNISCQQLSPDTFDLLCELGVDVNQKSQISVVPVSGGSGARSSSAYTLVVTNFVDDHMVSDTIFVHDDDGIVPLRADSDLTRAGNIYSFANSGKVAVRATAAYNPYTTTGSIVKDYYSQPIGVSFTYTKSDASANVTRVLLRYFCAGQVYSVPNLVDQGYDDSHTISVSQNNPLVSTHYGTTNQYSTTKAMWTSGLLAIANQYMYYEATINGTRYSGVSPSFY